MSAGAPSPDSRQVCSPSASESRFSSWLDAGVEPGGSFVGGEQVGLQRGLGDRGAGVLVGDWICLQRMDFLQQVAVPVEECAVDSGRASDCGRADPVAGGGGLVEHRQHALASAHRVVAAAVEHRPGLVRCVRVVSWCGHALASEAVWSVVRAG